MQLHTSTVSGASVPIRKNPPSLNVTEEGGLTGDRLRLTDV